MPYPEIPRKPQRKTQHSEDKTNLLAKTASLQPKRVEPRRYLANIFQGRIEYELINRLRGSKHWVDFSVHIWWDRERYLHYLWSRRRHITVTINSACPHVFESSNWILESSIKMFNYWTENSKREIWDWHDMIFSKLPGHNWTHFCLWVFNPIFEHSIWLLHNHFWTFRFLKARAV